MYYSFEDGFINVLVHYANRFIMGQVSLSDLFTFPSNK